MLVKDLMSPNVITVKPTATLEMVAEVLHKYHFTGVPVVDGFGTLLGTIMERDFITKDSKLYLPTYIQLLKNINFYGGDKRHLSKEVEQVMSATAADVMNKNVVYVYADTTVEDLAKVFAEKRVNPVPVVDSHFKLVGIISRSDLIKLFSKDNIQKNEESESRIIDAAAEASFQVLDQKFVFVDKARTSVWMLISFAMLFIGFFLGIAWMIQR